MSGFIIGILLGFIMKRSRLCFAGNLRDVYLEKRVKGFYVFLLIILTTSLIYFGLISLKMIPQRPEQAPFSILAAAVGGLTFGLGAVLSNGCVASSLLKAGDGRLAGVMSLLSFAIFATATKQGTLSAIVASMNKTMVVKDSLFEKIPFSIYFIIVPAFVIVGYFTYKNWKAERNSFKLPHQYSGLRYYLFEKKLDTRIAALVVGILAGVAFFFSFLTGRYGSLGITTPIISWLAVFNQNVIELNWASFFVVGMIVGSFIYALGSSEFSFKGTDGKTLVRSLLGGALMGFGAVAGNGCLVGNGIVGTAMFSTSAWFNFAFIVTGIWLGSYVLFVKPMKSVTLGNGGKAYAN